MHAKFQEIKAEWWWIESPQSLGRFSQDGFAQGFEIDRRVERIAKLLPVSHCDPAKTWKKLYRWQKDYFCLNSRRQLAKLGLIKSITVGPRGIGFNASQSIPYLLKALKYELINPTPLMCGPGLPEQLPATPYWVRVVSKFSQGKAGPIHTRLQEQAWEKGKIEPGAYLPIPLVKDDLGQDRELTAREIFAYFRNFIKDNPPPDFMEYRRSLRNKARAPREPVTRTIALGLLAHDYAKLPDSRLNDLALWVGRVKKSVFNLDEQQAVEALYNAKVGFSRLFQRADLSAGEIWRSPLDFEKAVGFLLG